MECAVCRRTLEPDDLACPSCGSGDRHIIASDRFTLEDRFVEIEGRGPDESQMLHTSPAAGRKAIATSSSSGNVSGTVAKGASPGEANVQFACKALVEKLNEGDHPEWLLADEQPPPGHPDDCWVMHDGHKLGIQVTRAHWEQALWKQLANDGVANVQSDIDRLADALIKAILSKAKKASPAQRRSQLLALDATDTPHVVLRDTVARFRHKHGADAVALGYAAIWLVGPNRRRTARLA